MGCITLLSDFGLQDATVAITKGILLQYTPDNSIVDITHDVLPFNKRQAAYLLGATYKNFPEGTVHIPLLDIFSGTRPTLILGAFEGHYFLCADNGLLPLALHTAYIPCWQCLQFDAVQSYHQWLHRTGEIIRNLATMPPEELGLQVHIPALIQNRQSTNPNIIDGEIIHIDPFGNVVLDITRLHLTQLVPNGGQFSLQYIQYEEIREISTNYTDVRPGNKLCRFNNNGHLEISIHNGNAAQLFGLKMGSQNNKIQISYHDQPNSTNEL